jgi:hypothetical protein
MDEENSIQAAIAIKLYVHVSSAEFIVIFYSPPIMKKHNEFGLSEAIAHPLLRLLERVC